MRIGRQPSLAERVDILNGSRDVLDRVNIARVR